MSTGRKSRRKGYRGEYEIRKLLTKAGLKVRWQAEDPASDDINVEGYDAGVKYRMSIPLSMYRWLGEKGADMLFVRRVSCSDRGRPWLVVMKLETFIELIKGRADR